MDKSSKSSSEKDNLTAQQTFKFLLRQRQLHQFALRDARIKKKELEKEEEEARKQIKFFNNRIMLEIKNHGDALQEFGIIEIEEEE